MNVKFVVPPRSARIAKIVRGEVTPGTKEHASACSTRLASVTPPIRGAGAGGDRGLGQASGGIVPGIAPEHDA